MHIPKHLWVDAISTTFFLLIGCLRLFFQVRFLIMLSFQQSHCFLLSQKYLVALILFEMFTLILQKLGPKSLKCILLGYCCVKKKDAYAATAFRSSTWIGELLFSDFLRKIKKQNKISTLHGKNPLHNFATKFKYFVNTIPLFIFPA